MAKGTKPATKQIEGEVDLKQRVTVYGTGAAGSPMKAGKAYEVSPLVVDNLISTGHATREPKGTKPSTSTED